MTLLNKVKKVAQIRLLRKSYEKLTIKELQILIASLKRDGDKKVPSKKNELITRLSEWEARGVVVVEDKVAIVVVNAASKIRNESLQDTELLED